MNAGQKTGFSFKIIGKRRIRVDALGKVTGRAKFAEDYSAPHQLYGKVLHARYPHARILAVRTEGARKLPGVAAVLTARDIPGSKTFGTVVPDQPVLAEDKVRYLGDGVALVAAESPEIAEQALSLIEVEYEPLPGVFSPLEAMKTKAPRVHEGGNIVNHHKVRKGDVKAGFREAEIVLERNFTTQHVEHSYIEPEAVLAEPGEQGGVRITGSVQNQFNTRRAVAAVLGLDLARVQIRQATLGGSFGGKDEAATVLCCRAALLALATGRPVKMVNTREDSMLESYKRHPYFMRYKVGAKRDGTLTAFQIRCVADAGAYAATTPFVTWRSVVQATGPYRCDNVKTDTFGVYTNNVYTGAMRGFGSPQVCFASETLMDELAEKLGMTPLELRLRAALRDGDRTATGQLLPGKVSLFEVLQKIAGASDFERKWRTYREERQKPDLVKRGIGLACSYRGVSLGAEGVDAAGVIVSVQTDGSVILSSGITDMGQGAQTVLSQIAAEVLGIGLERIRFLNTNTSRVPDSGPTVASRSTIVGGSAAKKAAEDVLSRMLPVAAELLNARPRSVITGEDHFIDLHTRRRVPFGHVAAACFQRGISLFGFGWFKAPHITWDEETGQGDAYFTYVYGANVAEVEVDTGTGRVNVVRFYSAHEVGRAINRAMVEAQIYGGVAMGLGYGLLEEFELQEGWPGTLNFDRYLLPTALDVPKVECIVVENPDPLGPFGAKSLGEPTNEIAAPAIVNAIANATGRRIYQLPATLEQVVLGRKLRKPLKKAEAAARVRVAAEKSCKVKEE